jgi:hypothetical protein
VPPVVVPGPYPLSLQAAIDSAAPGAVIDVTGGPVYREKVRIARPLTLVGAVIDCSSFTGDTDYGIHIDKAHDVNLLGCEVGHVRYAGIMGISAWNVKVDGCKVHDIDENRQRTSDWNAYGIAASDYGSNRSHDWTITNNVIDNVPNWHGIDTHGGQRITITGNTVHRCNRAIFITDSDAAKADLITINSNLVDTPTRRSDVLTRYPYNEVGITVIAGSTGVRGDGNAYDGWPTARSGVGVFSNDKVTNPQ